MISAKKSPIVSILCDSPDHPVIPYLDKFVRDLGSEGLKASLYKEVDELPAQGCDLLFLVSANTVIKPAIIGNFNNVLVLHASDLPAGRGWSPHIWQIIEGANTIRVTLVEAVEEVDAGPIVSQKVVHFDGTELYDEINEKLFKAEIALMAEAIEKWPNLKTTPQREDLSSKNYRKRTPSDSEVDPRRTIAEQFDILRVSDPTRYPAFFKFRGQKYRIILEKLRDESA